MASETKAITTRVPLDPAEKVEALASWGEQEEERHRMTLEALEDVDAGRVIDHESILAWAESRSFGAATSGKPLWRKPQR